MVWPHIRHLLPPSCPPAHTLLCSHPELGQQQSPVGPIWQSFAIRREPCPRLPASSHLLLTPGSPSLGTQCACFSRQIKYLQQMSLPAQLSLFIGGAGQGNIRCPLLPPQWGRKTLPAAPPSPGVLGTRPGLALHAGSPLCPRWSQRAPGAFVPRLLSRSSGPAGPWGLPATLRACDPTRGRWANRLLDKDAQSVRLTWSIWVQPALCAGLRDQVPAEPGPEALPGEQPPPRSSQEPQPREITTLPGSVAGCPLPRRCASLVSCLWPGPAGGWHLRGDSRPALQGPSEPRPAGEAGGVTRSGFGCSASPTLPAAR